MKTSAHDSRYDKVAGALAFGAVGAGVAVWAARRGRPPRLSHFSDNFAFSGALEALAGGAAGVALWQAGSAVAASPRPAPRGATSPAGAPAEPRPAWLRAIVSAGLVGGGTLAGIIAGGAAHTAIVRPPRGGTYAAVGAAVDALPWVISGGGAGLIAASSYVSRSRMWQGSDQVAAGAPHTGQALAAASPGPSTSEPQRKTA